MSVRVRSFSGFAIAAPLNPSDLADDQSTTDRPVWNCPLAVRDRARVGGNDFAADRRPRSCDATGEPRRDAAGGRSQAADDEPVYSAGGRADRATRDGG